MARTINPGKPEAGAGEVFEPRRSKRKRRATKRFADGWCAMHLWRLASALGAGVSDRER